MKNPVAIPTAPGASGGASHAASQGAPLLVVTTGEDGSAALQAARLLASRRAAQVSVLSVIEPDPATVFESQFAVSMPEYAARRLELRKAAVAEQVREVAGSAAAWPVDVRFGATAPAIAAVADRLDAALIIMGSGKHDPITRLLAGETTLRTIRQANRPVLAVASDFRALARVAVAAVDFSPSSVMAARRALDLLGEGATLYLVHVWSRHGDHPSMKARDEAYEQRLPGLFTRLEEEVAAPAGVTVQPVSLLGARVEELLKFAESYGADLIAAGRQGHGFLERLLVGSVTTALLRGATCAVLVVPEPTVEEADRLAREVMGMSAARAPKDWASWLDAFSRRNQGRRTVLQVDDPHVGVQVQAAGYALLGAAYDHNDRRVELMLGDAASKTRHLTHTIEEVTAISVRTDARGRDATLLVAHQDGQVLLTFVPSDEA
ncbi:MAG TPA: universal stress protein [Gemmatimonadaceae bacterium]